MLAKTLWKIHMRKDSLWIQLINHMYNRFDSVWHWDWHREDSPLIKTIIRIQDLLVTRCGSIEAAVLCLQGWFDGGGGISCLQLLP